jgi:hypothetical protein
LNQIAFIRAAGASLTLRCKGGAVKRFALTPGPTLNY